MRSFAGHQKNGNQAAADANTIIGDKMIFVHTSGALTDGWPAKDDHHEIVLQSSRQCLPMIRFDQGLIHHNEGKAMVEYIKSQLQQIMNTHFNRNLKPNVVTDALLLNPNNRGGLSRAAAMGLGRAVQMPPMPPSAPALPAQHFINPSLPANPNSVASAWGQQFFPVQTMPPPLAAGAPAIPTTVSFASGTFIPRRQLSSGPSSTQTLTYKAPAALNGGVPADAYKKVPRSHDMNDDCVICMDSLRKGRCVALRKCGQ